MFGTISSFRHTIRNTIEITEIDALKGRVTRTALALFFFGKNVRGRGGSRRGRRARRSYHGRNRGRGDILLSTACRKEKAVKAKGG
jgi:hypothetical protein